MSTDVTSNTEVEIQQNEENGRLLQLQRRLDEIEDRLLTLSENIDLCKSVRNDLMALKTVLTSKSHLLQKLTEE